MTRVPRLKLARLPTPLEPLVRLSKEVRGPRIWMKRDDLTATVATGNKLRKLEFVVAQAMRDGARVLITCGGVQSNHCRATAQVAARLGLNCHLILRGEPGNDGNLLLDQLFGAEITYMAGRAYHEGLDDKVAALVEDYAATGKKAHFIPVGASDEVGLWGYIAAAEELKADFERAGIHPGAIVSATGSGGTQGGLVVGNHRHGLQTQVLSYSVSNKVDYFREKIGADLVAWQARYQESLPELPLDIVDTYIGPGYGKADPHVYETIARVARTEGVVLDPVYTGKAFDAMLQEIAAGRFDGMQDIVFLHTGGIFGIFPHREQFRTTTTP